MIHRKFENLKFRRTYIGGSRKAEARMFTEVQGTKEDNSECNWLEYRDILKTYCDDKLNILISWIYVTKNLRIPLVVLALLVSIANAGVGMVIFTLATISHGAYWYLKSLELKRLSDYNFSLDTINRETGLDLAKN